MLRRLTLTVIAAGLVGIGATVGACGEGYVPRADSDVDPESDATVDAGDGVGGDADAAVPDGNSDETGADGGADAEDADSGEDAEPSSCVANNDGVVERSEVTFRPGLQATFRVARDVQVDTTGRETEEGRVWDYTKSYEGDHSEVVKLQPLEGRWFESEFPDGDYAMKLVGDSEELGVFRATSDALLLLGLVSPEDDGATTEIKYDPPVEVLKFPLQEGETWRTETEASGTHAVWSPFVEISWDETYFNEVDAEGTLKTPYGTFDVLRVRTRLEQDNPAGFPRGEIRTFAFVAECFSTVATIRSDRGEDEVEFEEAASIRRIAK